MPDDDVSAQRALPICLSGPDLTKDAQDDGAKGCVTVQFNDVEKLGYAISR